MASARTNKGKMEGRATTIPYVNHISACHVKTRDQIHGVGWLFSGCMNHGDFFCLLLPEDGVLLHDTFFTLSTHRVKSLCTYLGKIEDTI